MTDPADIFGKHAREYARYRPLYPPELFAFLASVSPARRLAWDCGTGNGQAARALADHFDRIIATDASLDQLARASRHDRIEYRAELAEESRLEDASVDLVTAATAVHWFDLERFYGAVRRVAVPEGVLAVWTYHMAECEAAIDQVVSRYYWEVLAGYWPAGFRHVEARYETIPSPEFEMRLEWDLGQFLGFLSSWSATQAYLRDHGLNPLDTVREDLARAWGDPAQRRLVRWPIHLKVGRIGKGRATGLLADTSPGGD
jgi:SAM-dependent methyltransferase